jgi:hypothetical protein
MAAEIAEEYNERFRQMEEEEQKAASFRAARRRRASEDTWEETAEMLQELVYSMEDLTGELEDYPEIIRDPDNFSEQELVDIQSRIYKAENELEAIKFSLLGFV